MQREGLNKLYRVIENAIPKNVISNKNRNRSWLYGYNEKYDLVVISKTGQIEQVIEVNGLLIALPKAPKSLQRDKDYWERKQLPKPLSQINSIFQWNTMPDSFKSRWVDFIEDEFDKRELGYWFVNDKVPTYITGAHYMYLQWTSIDVGYPEFREANRIFYIYWEACRADHRCFGMMGMVLATR